MTEEQAIARLHAHFKTAKDYIRLDMEYLAGIYAGFIIQEGVGIGADELKNDMLDQLHALRNEMAQARKEIAAARGAA